MRRSLFSSTKSFADVNVVITKTVFRIPLSQTSSCEAKCRIANDGDMM